MMEEYRLQLRTLAETQRRVMEQAQARIEEQAAALNNIMWDMPVSTYSLIEAEGRARPLLMSLLAPTQRLQIEREHAFGVIGSQGGLFVIEEPGYPRDFNPYVWGDLLADSRLASFCIQSRQMIPHSDRLLSWKLWLEGNEGMFRGVAVASSFYEAPGELGGGQYYTKLRRLAHEVRAGRVDGH